MTNKFFRKVLGMGLSLLSPLACLVLFAICLSGCGSSDDPFPIAESAVPPGPSGGPVPIPSEGVTLFSNATDPQFAQFIEPDGTQVDVFGRRDSNGVPTKADFVRVTNNAGEETLVQLDSQDRPIKLTAFNGVVFDLVWETTTRAVVTATNPSGDGQFTTPIDFVGTVSGRNGLNNLPRREGAARVTFRQDSESRILQQSGPPPSGVARIEVFRCGVLEGNASVSLLVRDSISQEVIGNFPASPTDTPGVFETQFPNGSDVIDNSLENCESIAGVLGSVCEAAFVGGLTPQNVAPACLSFAAALDAITLPAPGDIVLYNSGCLSAFAAVPLYCDTVGLGEPGGDDIAGFLCSQLFSDRFAAGQTLTAVVTALPSDVLSEIQTISASESSANLVVDLGGEPALSQVVLTPSSPEANEDYVASLTVSCIPGNSLVRLSVVGSDGFTDQIEFPINDEQVSGTFELSVPGAAEGVRDVITVDYIPDILTPIVITKDAVLFFGLPTIGVPE